MSFNVLIIPEDFRRDQYVLRPLVERMLEASSRGRARVRVCQEPLLGSISAALRWSRIQEIVESYRGYVDCFLLIVDRDCDESRRQKLDGLEKKASEILDRAVFFAENAWQEIEVWLLAGMKDLPADWAWQEVREDCHPKESRFEPYVRSRGLEKAPFGGRKRLGEEAARNYPRVERLCDEVESLRRRLESVFAKKQP